MASATRVDHHSVSVQFTLAHSSLWWLTCVYGPQSNDDKLLFLQESRDLRSGCIGPWLIVGDFNIIVREEEKNTGIINRAMMGRFRWPINDLNLKELPMVGRRFTWSNQQDNPTLVKLDRVLCSIDWEQLFFSSNAQENCASIY